MTSTLQRLTSKLPTEVNKVVRRLAVASLIGQTVLIVTGGAVRLTASGLGCPTWPRCTADSLVNTPEMGLHGVIEFGNRTLTIALAIVAILMLVFLWNIRRERRDLFLLALGLLASIPAQAIIGGITVLTKLNPWVVGLHFIVSIALVAIATLLVNRVYGRTGRSAPAVSSPLSATLRQLSVVIVISTAVAVVLGVIVTGAGPHAGDSATPRNGLDLEFIARIHVLPVYVLVAATAAAIAIALRQRAPRRYQRALYIMAAALVLQAGVGYIQYFTGVPAILVGLHMLGSAVLLAAATNVVDLGLYKPRRLDAESHSVPV